jgi:integrase
MADLFHEDVPDNYIVAVFEVMRVVDWHVYEVLTKYPERMRQMLGVLRRKIQPKAKELGLPHVTWRLLRHWNSTVLQDSGVPVRVAMERLGHSRPETTLRHYSHVTISKADEAAQILSTMFGNRAS